MVITFPGGQVEPSERIVDATGHEINEETGLAVTALGQCGVTDWYHIEEIAAG